MKPKIKFKLNINLDKQTCFNFLNLKYGGIDFGKSIVSLHPSLKNIKKIKTIIKRREAISQYINQFYNLHNNELKEALDYFQKEWNEVKQPFFQITDEIFKSFSWPKGKYICYLSIFNCHPRFLDNKTFQVYYKNKSEIKRIITHELLHFIFYHYLKNKFKNKISINKKWIISEIFNTIILNQKKLGKLIAPSKELGYPEHKKYIRLLASEWKRNKNISMWLKKAIEFVP